MTKKLFSKIFMLAIFAGVFGMLHYAHAQAPFTQPVTSTEVGNVSPVITATVADGGSNNGSGLANNKGNPTNVGSNITFTATALDVNGDQYYLAVCKTDAVTAVNSAPPTCATEQTWAVSGITSSTLQASVTYTTLTDDVEENAWFAFVCDHASTSLCYPANGNGDQGSAIGTVTFTDRPADGARVAIDSKIFEFDHTDGLTCVAGADVCMNASAVEDGAGAAALLAAQAPTVNFYMVSRGAVVYVYAAAAGAGGNSIALADTGDTGNIIALSGAMLAGGDDDNKSPFYVNHKPVIATSAFGDTIGTGLFHATGTVEPGDTLYISANITDSDTNVGQDTVSMYVCETEGFAAGATPGCTGVDATLCSVTGVNPTTDYARCGFTKLTTVPTAHGTYTVYIYAVDNHGFQATESATRTFTVEDVAPYLDSSYGAGTGYINVATINPSAGGSAEKTVSVGIKDDNGDMDVDAVELVFFDAAQTGINNTCSIAGASENNCYVLTTPTCAFSTRTGLGSGKTATGSVNAFIVTCTYTMYFNANASTSWTLHAKPTDGGASPRQVTSLANSSTVATNQALQGIDIVEEAIAYGTVAIGGTSTPGVQTSMGNVGNQVIDVYISGSNMESGTYSIPAAQQKWHNANGTFDWDSTSTSGPWAMVEAASLTSEATGCANRDIAVRTNHLSEIETNESVWWKIRIPASQQAGSYTGANTFASTAEATCSTGTLH